MVIRIVRISDFPWVPKICRQHAANEFYRVFAVMSWNVGAVKETVIGNGNSFGATAMSNPNDPVGIDVVDQSAAGDIAGLGLIDESVRMF